MALFFMICPDISDEIHLQKFATPLAGFFAENRELNQLAQCGVSRGRQEAALAWKIQCQSGLSRMTSYFKYEAPNHLGTLCVCVLMENSSINREIL